MKNLDSIIDKTLAATGTFSDIVMDNYISKGSVGFEAKNNRLKFAVTGIVFDFNKNENSPNYKVLLTSIKSKGHRFDLKKARDHIKKNVEENQQEYMITIESKKYSETYSGTIISGIPIIKEATIEQNHNKEKNLNMETEFDLYSMADSLSIGFNNLLYERERGKIKIIRSNAEAYNTQSTRKSVIIDVVDGKFETGKIGEISDESLVRRIYIFKGDGLQHPHVRAGHIRHYLQKDKSIERMAVAPYAVKGNKLTQEQKEKYYLGPNGEITQETMILTEKMGTLDDKCISLLIEAHNIPTYEESYKSA